MGPRQLQPGTKAGEEGWPGITALYGTKENECQELEKGLKEKI